MLNGTRLSLWDTNRGEIEKFIEHANRHHATIKLTAEISDKETTFLHTCVYKGERFKKENILDVRSHFKPTETFQYTHYSSCHPPRVSKGFIKGEAPRLLRTNSSKTTFEENICNFRVRFAYEGLSQASGWQYPFRSEIHRKGVGSTTETKDAK